MNCANHADTVSAAYCVRCGRALCDACVRDVRGSIYCENCLADVVGKEAPPSQAVRSGPVPESGVNPTAAFALGLIPGVGAIYNGEFFKAAIHVLIFGSLVQFASLRGMAPLFSLLAFAFYWYMPFEAYYTARKRVMKAQGIDLETPFDRLYERIDETEKKEFWGGVALIALGGLFLLDNFNILRIDWIARLFWPVVLIGVGLWLLKRHKERTAQ
jgi:hypothetical protein